MSDPENKNDKNFYEAYALFKIGAAWPGYESGFEKFEQPDWINPERSIGLEVVQGITDTEGQFRAVTNSVLGTTLSDINDNEEVFLEDNCLIGTQNSEKNDRIQLHDSLAQIIDRPSQVIRATSLGKELGDANAYVPTVVSAIRKKLEKLNMNYINNRENHLAVLMGTAIDDSEFVEDIAHQTLVLYLEYRLRFNLVFLIYQWSVSRLMFSHQHFEIERIGVSSRAQTETIERTRRYAFGN